MECGSDTRVGPFLVVGGLENGSVEWSPSNSDRVTQTDPHGPMF